MKGTEKQIKWASKIRENILTALSAMSNTSMQAEFEAFCAWLDSKTDASWWIETWTMNGTVHMFLRAAMKAYKA